MAVNSSNINATDLDFDAIAENIKTYLKVKINLKTMILKVQLCQFLLTHWHMQHILVV